METQKYLDNNRVYLCGAMAAYADSGVSWRKWITPVLKEKYNLTVYDPSDKKVVSAGEIAENKDKFRELIMAEKWSELKTAFAPVVHWDLRAVSKADFLIVYYDATAPSVGTYHELAWAQYDKKPILVKYDKEKLDKFNPWISCLVKPHHLFSDWEKMFEYLDEINDGKIIDTEHWSTV